MNIYGVNELRRKFLDFFEGKGHLVHASYPLIPHNDNSVLLIPAGMAPLKPYFTGMEKPPCTRMATCQKCIRTGDMENVGKTARHGTFFEMLGNFSFGDYFKKEAIEWAWEFLTQVVGLDRSRLYPSVYVDDDEAFAIWRDDIGISPDRIFKFGKEDNFWEHGAGPCGPCSEIYYDRGEKYGCGRPGCTVGCDCDRYMEVWNIVFTQFEGDGKGGYSELETKNIDTGMGLERLAVVVQEKDSIFDIDTVSTLMETAAKMAGTCYGQDHKKDISLRVIADHIRSVVFMVSDGIMPSNEGRGYVLRRLLRRAARHGRMLGIKSGFLSKLASKVIELSHEAYPELNDKRDFIFANISREEEKFDATIDQGLELLNKIRDRLKNENSHELSGDEAFMLYDTYGFPLDLTEEILAEDGISVDRDGFARCMRQQKERARNSRKATNYMGAKADVFDTLPTDVFSKFAGYDETECQSHILAMASDNGLTDILNEGDTGRIITEKTPFYATMGGQAGDTGMIFSDDGAEFEVDATIALPGGRICHVGTVTGGSFMTGGNVRLCIDPERRKLISRNHSATHLLHAALREILGDHVTQAGSDVDDRRLRFDFTHFEALSANTIKCVQDMVNRMIEDMIPVETNIMSMDDAKKTGAMALFGEKYNDTVRVVGMGPLSLELCGGTHVNNTAQIGCFRILSESGVASGVRRIEAVTSRGLLECFDARCAMLEAAAAAAKSTPDTLEEKISHMQAHIKNLQAENESLKSKLAKDAAGDIDDRIRDISGVRFLAISVPGLDSESIRGLSDSMRDKIGSGVVVIASENDGRVSLVASATQDAINAGAHSGNIIKAIAPCIKGGGGGRPNMAQAGGRDASGIDDALNMAADILKGQLK